MKKWLIIGGSLLGVMLLFLLLTSSFFIKGYNRLVSFDETVQSKWAQVENQLKRRSDLIPDLVNTVKGYASHEKEVFTNIADARSKLAGAKSLSDKVAAANQFESALSRLLVIVERYPDLKANQNFSKLQYELSGTENRIAVERMRYNESVKMYNLVVKRFSGRFLAALFGFEKAEYFKIEKKDKDVPKVKF